MKEVRGTERTKENKQTRVQSDEVSQWKPVYIQGEIHHKKIRGEGIKWNAEGRRHIWSICVYALTLGFVMAYTYKGRCVTLFVQPEEYEEEKKWWIRKCEKAEN